MSHRITDWDPEDVVAWEAGNKRVARRNLIWSVAAEHIGFSIWSIWSVMVLFMPETVYGFTAGDKFLLGATATLVGACLRIPYTLATATFGGRNWTVFSAFVLLIPTIGTMWLLAHPGLPLWPYLVCAALTGFGGGNFASSMTNINAFYPQRLKGWALGVNAGGGNIGVPMIQLVGLLVIATAGNRAPYWVCAVYLVALAVAGIGAAAFMDNLEQHKIDLTAMGAILRHRDTWVISLLYIGTFGSFIGFAFAFGQVLQINFAAGGQNPAQASLHAAQIAFVGPLLGSLSRVYGGKLADRVGGGRVTLAVFAGMILAAGAPGRRSSTADDHTRRRNCHHDGRLCHRFHRAVPAVRDRQRLGLQDDPVDLRGPQPLAGGRRGRAAALVTRDVGRVDRVRRCDRRTRRCRHQPGAAAVLPEQWIGHLGVLDLPGVLCARLGGDVGDVRPAPGLRPPGGDRRRRALRRGPGLRVNGHCHGHTLSNGRVIAWKHGLNTQVA